MSAPRNDGARAEVGRQPPPRWRSIGEAATVLNVPENWLRKKVSARAVPFTRIGRHVRFTAAHLEQIIRAGEQAPIVLTPRQLLSRPARRAG